VSTAEGLLLGITIHDLGVVEELLLHNYRQSPSKEYCWEIVIDNLGDVEDLLLEIYRQ
jgi:hypothetical protein